YLFLCPIKDLKIGSSSFRWPDCPVYWSLAPAGDACLSTEEARRLGFPSLELRIHTWARSWDASVYSSLSQFHQAKGFIPDSQDVARHLGAPLFQL
ncbi:hypothetical protein DFH07DRAFT_698688, partial [Mycena maculata]